MDENSFSEKGQALILVVLAIIALLGFTALAVDGSMVYSDRRFDQNAADASSLAGGAAAAMSIENSNLTYKDWNCGSSKIKNAIKAANTAAITRAKNNGFDQINVIDPANLPNPKMGVYTICGVIPKSLPSQPFADKYLDVHTWISSDTKTSFAHFVFPGLVRNTVEAITRVRPRTTAAFGMAIVALNEKSCEDVGVNEGASYHGGKDVIVEGGGIYANGCLRDDGTGNVIVNNGSISYQYKRPSDTFGNMSPFPQQHDEPLPLSVFNITPPNCSDPGANTMTGNNFVTAAESGLAPGLYCVTSKIDGFKNNTKYSGDGITIVLLNGFFTANSGAEINFSAPVNENPAPAVRGLLLYLPPSNSNTVKLNGNANSSFSGTILATQSQIMVEGCETGAYHGQIIGFDVQIGGTSGTSVIYDEGVVAWIPAMLELNR